jgi:hypothetical protein
MDNASLFDFLKSANCYDEKKYDFIDKYKNLDKNAVDAIIKKMTEYTYKYGVDADFMKNKDENRKKIIEKLLDSGYLLSKENYRQIIASYDFQVSEIDLTNVLKNFVFDNFDELIKYIKNNRLYFYSKKHKYLNLEIYGKDKINEHLSYLYCLDSDTNTLRNLLKEKNIPLTQKHLDYAKYASVKKIIKENLTDFSKKNAEKIDTNDNDNKLLDCKTIDEMDNFILKNKYKISPQTLILACQKNIDFSLITHLVMQKLIFNENQINEIIRSYSENENIAKLLAILSKYGSVFSKNNYLEMLTSKYYHLIFSEKLSDNIIIDEDFINRAHDAFIVFGDMYNYDGDSDNVKQFLENIEEFGHKNEKSAECILALYCATMSKIHSAAKIKELKKSFGVKFTPLCLTYLYKDRNNAKKEIMNLFLKDGVVPDVNVANQLVKTYMPEKAYELYSMLLKK